MPDMPGHSQNPEPAQMSLRKNMLHKQRLWKGMEWSMVLLFQMCDSLQIKAFKEVLNAGKSGN
jgi:hypothetical protein